MERSIFRKVRRTLRSLGRRRANRRFLFTDATVLEVYLWATLWDRPVCWACKDSNWPAGMRQGLLPDASTISRRMKSRSIVQLIERLRRKLEPDHDDELIAIIDGKALPIGPHSHDKQAGYGRSTSGKAKGYKFHTIIDQSGRVLAWRLAPMNTDERKMARRMLRELGHKGYMLADANYDSNTLFDIAMEQDIQLIAPRRYGPQRGLGRRYQSPARLRSKEILENDPTGFGRDLMHHRWSVERFFGTLSSVPTGLGYLPAWVRSWRRVRNWVAAKLTINAARAAVNMDKIMQ